VSNDNGTGNGNQRLVKPEWACPVCGERRMDWRMGGKGEPDSAYESTTTPRDVRWWA
jgi:hypothetical protein